MTNIQTFQTSPPPPQAPQANNLETMTSAQRLQWMKEYELLSQAPWSGKILSYKAGERSMLLQLPSVIANNMKKWAYLGIAEAEISIPGKNVSFTRTCAWIKNMDNEVHILIEDGRVISINDILCETPTPDMGLSVDARARNHPNYQEVPKLTPRSSGRQQAVRKNENESALR